MTYRYKKMYFLFTLYVHLSMCQKKRHARLRSKNLARREVSRAWNSG